MNNEEKILAMLEKLTNDMTDVKAAQTEQGKQLAELTNKVDGIDTRLGKVECRLEKAEDMQEELRDSVNILTVKIDHNVIPYVKLLDEDYSNVGRRVTALEKAN